MPAIHSQSERLSLEAEQHLPGGVNSPVRAFRAVGGHPVVIQSASGCHMTDVDGNTYTDFVGSWGPMILGHAHPAVISAVQQVAQFGLSFGATSPREVELAKAGSGAMTLALPDSAGVPPSVTQHTYTVPFNDLGAVRALLAEKGQEIGVIVVEPVAGNMGLIPPQPGFLQGLRDVCDEHSIVLVFDEVMTGFRLSRSGAQGLYGIIPDMTVLGKIVGGGMPLACYGGKRALMEKVAPLGPVYQAGTLSGNPVAVTAGLTTLEQIDAQPDLYQHLESIGAQLQSGLEKILQDTGVVGRVQRVGSMWTLFFTDQPVVDYVTAKTCDTQRFASFFRGMLAAGFYLPPSQFEAAFLGAAHRSQDIDAFLQAASRVLGKVS